MSHSYSKILIHYVLVQKIGKKQQHPHYRSVCGHIMLDVILFFMKYSIFMNSLREFLNIFNTIYLGTLKGLPGIA